MSDRRPPDPDEVRAFAFTAFSQLQGFLIAGTIYVGERLGLYRALAEAAGPVSAEALAEATGLHPRWVLEWLRAQGAAQLVDHRGDERFELSPAGVEVLANEDSLFYAAGAFGHLPRRAGEFEEITESFQTADAAGIENVTFHHASDDPLPADHSFDLVMTLDCVHDMTRPREVVRALWESLRADGTWLWGEPKALPTYEENVAGNPMAAMMYATSIFGCMASGMAEPDGAGLGTLGIHEERAREMAAAAGFGRFEAHDFGNPVNVYFEVRP